GGRTSGPVTSTVPSSHSRAGPGDSVGCEMAASVAAAMMEPARTATIASPLRRVATAVVFIPVFVWVVTRAPAWMFPALVSAAAVGALWELYRLFAHAGQPCNGRLGILLGLALVVSFEIAGGNAAVVPALPALVLGVAVAAILTAPVPARFSASSVSSETSPNQPSSAPSASRMPAASFRAMAACSTASTACSSTCPRSITTSGWGPAHEAHHGARGDRIDRAAHARDRVQLPGGVLGGRRGRARHDRRAARRHRA